MTAPVPLHDISINLKALPNVVIFNPLLRDLFFIFRSSLGT